MSEWCVHVWGGAWNDDAYPSIEKDYGIKDGYYYFKSRRAVDKFLSIISQSRYAKQGIGRDVKSGEMTHKKTAFVGIYEYLGEEFTIHYDLGYEYPYDSAVHYFVDGDMSCDCNRSLIIQREYGEAIIPLLPCGSKIKLVWYEVRFVDSSDKRYDGDDLMRRIEYEYGMD